MMMGCSISRQIISDVAQSLTNASSRRTATIPNDERIITINNNSGNIRKATSDSNAVIDISSTSVTNNRRTSTTTDKRTQTYL
jgi:hypothetical protein